MFQRIYVNNFRCLENFELSLKDISSALFIGKNGVGKSTIAKVLEIFQSIGRGTAAIKKLVDIYDFAFVNTEKPMRFEMDLILHDVSYKYTLALKQFDEYEYLSLFEEKLIVSEEVVFHRCEEKEDGDFEFISNHLIMLPLLHDQPGSNAIYNLRNWLARLIILSPIPNLMMGDSNNETLEVNRDGTNIGDWFSGLLGRYPAAYRDIDNYLREVIPDFSSIENELVTKQSKTLFVSFGDEEKLSVEFKRLSDGEKCFFLGALVLAFSKYCNPSFCFWDEPGNYISLSEVGYLVMALRRAFENLSGGQLLMTSHNIEAIHKFSSEKTFFLDRKSHWEPTLIRPLSEISIDGDLIDNLVMGDIEL